MRSERKKTTKTSEKMEIGEKKSPKPRQAREPRPRASEVSSLSLWSESLSLGLLCLGFLKFVYGYFGWYMILQIFLKFFFGYKSSLRGSILRWLPHGKKMPHQMWLDHKNRVSKTWFIDQNRASKTRDASKKKKFWNLNY